MQQFTSIHDIPNLQILLNEALEIKKNPYTHEQLGKRKTLGMLFLNPSLRTHWSSEKAAINLGMSVISSTAEQGWSLEFGENIVMDGTKVEHIKEAAAVISQYCDVLGVRCFASLDNQELDYQDFVLNQFIKYAKVPVVSLESAILHPLQSFADCITIAEHRPAHRPKVVLTWAPHPKALPQAVANSFSEWMQRMDVDFVVTHPKGYELASRFSENTLVEYDQNKAFANADFIYAKNWSSYSDYGKVLCLDKNWTVTPEKMALTNNAKFMHCLPVRRNMIVTDAVLDSTNSIVMQQAANRTVAMQTILKRMIQNLS